MREEFEINSVVTVIELSQKFSLKIVPYLKQKSDQKVKRITKKIQRDNS